jgi:hypothetical protein
LHSTSGEEEKTIVLPSNSHLKHHYKTIHSKDYNIVRECERKMEKKQYKGGKTR